MIADARVALAEVLRAGLDLAYGSPRVPSPLHPSTVFVVPQAGADYITYDDGGASFCRPVVNLSAIIVASTSNIAAAAEWLDDKLDRLPDVLNAMPTLGGVVSIAAVDAVTEPGMLALEGGASYLAAEVRMRPMTIRNQPQT